MITRARIRTGHRMEIRCCSGMIPRKNPKAAANPISKSLTCGHMLFRKYPARRGCFFLAGRWTGALSGGTRTPDRFFSFDTTTQKWTELPKFSASWGELSRRGDYLYFLGAPAGSQEGLYRFRVRDRKFEHVADLKDFRQAVGWGAFLGLAPDDSPLLLRDADTQDIYALHWEAP